VNQQDLQRLLADVDAGQEPLPHRLDYDRLLARGRRRERRRTTVRLGGAAGAVVATGGLVGTLSLAGGGTLAAGPAPATPAATTPAQRPATPPGPTTAAPGIPTLDPTTQVVDLGWVPPGLVNRQIELTAKAQQVVAYRLVGNAEDDVTLTAHGPGWTPEQSRSDGQPDSPQAGCNRGAPDGQVQGRPAYRMIAGPNRPDGYCVGLMWQQPDGTWLDVRVGGFAGKTDPARIQIARQAGDAAQLTGVRRPARMPFTVSGRLAGLRVTQSTMWLAGPGAPASTPKGGLLMFANPANGKQVSALCVPGDDSGNPRRSTPNTQVDGHPAHVSADQVVVHGVQGCLVQVENEATAVPGARTLVDVYRLVHPVRNPADPANWTAHPLG